MSLPLNAQPQPFAHCNTGSIALDVAVPEHVLLALEDIAPPAAISTAQDSTYAAAQQVPGLAVKLLNKFRQLVREEFAGLHLRLFAAQLMQWPLPMNVGGRVRVRIMRLVGFDIGHGTVMADMPQMTGGKNIYRNLTIGKRCWFNVGCFFDLGAAIAIGDNVSIGQQVVVLTDTHEIGSADMRAGTLYSKPVTIGDGSWLGARVTILPGINIGAGAVVAAGSVVHEDVPPNTVVAGVPARVVKSLS